ncbi:MAG TPA: hypothetical protein VJU77_11050 [Chthoniobacterales bacterium]|nr:hypothetical protein [Chthoniobacterales bacterium]
MTKRVLFAVAGFLGFCLPVGAQQLSGPERLLLGGSALDYTQSPWISLENRDRFLFSTAFGSMRPSENYLPPFDPSEKLSYSAPRTLNDKNPVDNIVELTAPSRFYYGGEIGFLYGKSTGKYGREDFSSYILGTIGNDKFQLTAGFLHQETTLNYQPRRIIQR